MKNIGKCKKWRILACIGILCMLFACADHMLQDDERSTTRRSKNKNRELTSSAAKEWFESNYAPVVTTRTSGGEGKELAIKPYWDKAKESNRGRFEVVETPTLSKGIHIILDEETTKHWQPGMKADYIRNTTKMVVLKDLVTNKTRSFIMVFVGSYDYLTRSRNMGRNSYLYREPDYDGMVLYYAINGTFINGWRYSNGKLVGYISPSYNEQGESSAQTRGYYDCHDVYTTEYRQDCHDEYELVGGDMETGLIYDIVNYCDYIPYTTSHQECHYVEDSTSDNNDDNWWNNPYPPGGAGNETNPVKPFDYTKVKSCKNLAETQKVIPFKLKELGINLGGIKLTENIECKSNAKRTKDGSEIQVCTKFYGRDVNDQTSIIYHEIYHIHNDINGNTDWDLKIQNLNNTRYLDTPPDNLMNYLRTLHTEDYNSTHPSGMSLDEYIKYVEFTVTSTLPPEYYLNDINAYTNEIKTVKDVTESYNVEREYGLWLHQQKYKIAKEEYK